CNLGFAAPSLPLGKKAAAASGKQTGHSQRRNANKPPTPIVHHDVDNAMDVVNAPSTNRARREPSWIVPFGMVKKDFEIGEEILMLSALDLARRIDAGTLKPVQVVDACAAAIAEHESEIGAFQSLDIESARQRAREPALPFLPLCGLPVGIKDIFDTAELPTG